MNADGTLARYEVCWVACGFNQQPPDVDLGESFLLVVKPAAELTLVATHNLSAHQLNSMSSTPSSTAMQPPRTKLQSTDFVDTNCPDDVCLLSRSLYGLRQAPRHERFVIHVTSLDFRQSRADSSLFIYHRNGGMTYLLPYYVDDMILSASSTRLWTWTTHHISPSSMMCSL